MKLSIELNEKEIHEAIIYWLANVHGFEYEKPMVGLILHDNGYFSADVCEDPSDD